MKGDLLFSVDLEDPRDHVENGRAYADRVRRNTERYLEFLRGHEAHGTFFVVGLIAERHPDLIRDIVAEGHEIACHGHTHRQLDRLTAESFEEDLQRNLDALHRCGVEAVHGFRAPTFSMTGETTWMYPSLQRLGFRYSSSVLPAASPLYGWPEFGAASRSIDGILEIPLTLHRGMRFPVAGGVYFRVLPFALIAHSVRSRVRRGEPILSYFHPYDIDEDQERFQHPDLSGSRLLNRLMYVGRSKVLPRLERLMKYCRITSYRDYVERSAA